MQTYVDMQKICITCSFSSQANHLHSPLILQIHSVCAVRRTWRAPAPALGAGKGWGGGFARAHAGLARARASPAAASAASSSARRLFSSIAVSLVRALVRAVPVAACKWSVIPRSSRCATVS